MSAASLDDGELSRAALADDLKSKGNDCFKEKRYHKAIYFYSQALDEWPNPVILSNRAQANLNLHKYEAAYSDANEALLLDSTNLKALFRRALALHKLGLAAKAHADLIGCVKRDPKNKEAKQLLKELKNAQDKGVVDVTHFEKSDSIKSKRPLVKQKIVINESLGNAKHVMQRIEVQAPTDEFLDFDVISKLSVKDDDLTMAKDPQSTTQSQKAKSDSLMDVNTPLSNYKHLEDINTSGLPKPANNFNEFLRAWIELQHEPTAFATYILTLDLDKFGVLFDNVADMDILPTLIHGLYQAQLHIPQALYALLKFSKTSRFDISAAFLDDSSKDELSGFLLRFGADFFNEVQEIQKNYFL